jgi:predicted  nucleic acid-binding Zn-ribbon protein
MQHELVSLDRRISELEDTELEVMEQLENAQAQHARLAERLVAIEARTGELTASRDAAAGDVTQESTQVTGQRKVVADGVPDDLLAVYEKVRAQKGGVGAAALRARRCGGCSLELTASDLGSIAKAPLDEVLRCEECNRILVRTSESGI